MKLRLLTCDRRNQRSTDGSPLRLTRPSEMQLTKYARVETRPSTKASAALDRLGRIPRRSLKSPTDGRHLWLPSDRWPHNLEAPSRGRRGVLWNCGTWSDLPHSREPRARPNIGKMGVFDMGSERPGGSQPPAAISPSLSWLWRNALGFRSLAARPSRSSRGRNLAGDGARAGSRGNGETSARASPSAKSIAYLYPSSPLSVFFSSPHSTPVESPSTR
jgi:hypothetical protein